MPNIKKLIPAPCQIPINMNVIDADIANINLKLRL